MSDDDVAKRIAKLEAELAALRAKVEPPEPKPQKPWPKFDPTAGMGMSADAARKMAWVAPNAKPQTAEEVRSSWARTRISGPGGFGPPDGKWDKPQPVEKPAVGPPVDSRSPQTRNFDDMVAYWAGGPNEPVK